MIWRARCTCSKRPWNSSAEKDKPLPSTQNKNTKSVERTTKVRSNSSNQPLANTLILTFTLSSSRFALHLPEAAPPNVVLAQILELRRLRNQLINLRDDIQLLAGFEIPARQLLRHAIQHLERALVLHLSRVGQQARRADPTVGSPVGP